MSTRQKQNSCQLSVKRAVPCHLKEWGACVVMSVLVMYSPKVCAQEGHSFRQSFDTPPLLEKTIADAEEGYIIKGGEGASLKVRGVEYPLSRTKTNLTAADFNCLMATDLNVTGLKYSIDTDIKKEGIGSLNVKFRRKNLTYYAMTDINVFVPEFDASGTTIRVWVRSENGAGRAIYIRLMDGERICEQWAVYSPVLKTGEWQCLEMAQGKQSGATRHSSGSDLIADIEKVSSIQIMLFGYDETNAADYHVDALEIIPAQRVHFTSVMKIQGECYLRPEGGSDGLMARWFDPQMDDKDWKKVAIPEFWAKENDPAAWYRMRFTLSKEAINAIKGKPVFIVFGAVDESAWVWLNGEKIGSHCEGRKDGWDKPFALDVTGRLKLDGENLLAVKVLNREAAGGIWRPVRIVTEK